MKLDFVTIDVFTSTQFAGNPLGVVLNAEGLSGEQMQSIAAEFNLAETTFVLPPKDPAHTAEVRIFTPKREMPFAGHPNIGTAYALARAGFSYGKPIDSDHLIFEEQAGLVPITTWKDNDKVTGARLASPQLLTLGPDVAVETIAAACSLPADAIETRHHRPCVASCGTPFIIAQLKDRAALSAAAGRTDVFLGELSQQPASAVLIYSLVDEAEIDIRARMFAPRLGVHEDPATGSANVALIGLLAKLGSEADLHLTKRIAQGVEMGRPSLLHAEAEKKAGIVSATYIGGRCVPVMSGSIELA